jgi:hypothetical protein
MRQPFGDFLRTETDDVVLKSSDGGRTWSSFRDVSLTAYPWGCYGLPGKTKDGMLVSVISAPYVLAPEERRAHLERYGLTRFYNPRSEWLYTPWPASMADQLLKQGVFVHPPSKKAITNWYSRSRVTSAELPKTLGKPGRFDPLRAPRTLPRRADRSGTRSLLAKALGSPP